MTTACDEYCCQCGRKLTASRWWIAGISGGNAKHGPFCSTLCCEMSKPAPITMQREWTGNEPTPSGRG